MKQEIFDEVEHWLEFIKIWEQENEDEVPEQVILALENALENAVCIYKKEQSKSVVLEKRQNNSLH